MKAGYYVSIDADELDAFYKRLDNHQLLEEDYPTISTITRGYVAVLQALESKETSISRLRRIIFGASTEKTEKVLGDDDAAAKDDEAAEKKPRKKPTGHGKKSANEYKGANRIPVPHDTLEHGCNCPICGNGKVYREAKPRLKIWITGNAPLSADCYEREAFRCNLCGETFVAGLPEDVGDDKYDESAVSSLALMKYGTGMPFYRLEKFQESLGIPLPASTQWDLVFMAADRIQPAYREMLRFAAQGQLFYTDDTTMKLLEAPEATPDTEENEEADSAKARAVFTAGIVSVVGEQKVAIYATDRKHAGESFADLLERRAEDLAAPMQMADGLSRNIPKGFETILANCLADKGSS
jgi:hypothetical protein